MRSWRQTVFRRSSPVFSIWPRRWPMWVAVVDQLMDSPPAATKGEHACLARGRVSGMRR
jgi:hypothetical protein